MPYYCEPGDTIPLQAQFNDTDGSAAAATTPQAVIVKWNGDDPATFSELADSPVSLSNVPGGDVETGWYAGTFTVPSGLAAGTVLLVRFGGTCDSQTPAASDVIYVQDHVTPAEIDTYLSAQHGDGSWEGLMSAPTGPNTVTLTLECSGSAVLNQPCVVHTDAGTLVGFGYTDASGQTEFQLTNGNYQVRYGPSSNYEFSNPYDLTVSGDTTATYTCDAISHPSCGLTLEEMVSTLELTFARLDLKRPVEKALLRQWVNQSYQEVTRRMGWYRQSESFTTTSGQATYSYPVEHSSVVQVRAMTYQATDADKPQPMNRISLNEYISYRAEQDKTGDATYYVLEAEKIYLYPKPDESGAELEMFVIRNPAPLSDDADVPVIPCHLHQLIVTGALGDGYGYLGHQELSMAYRNIFDDQLTRAQRSSYEARSGGNDSVSIEV